MSARSWSEKDYYLELGVEEYASANDIAKAYRKLARATHPDLRPGDPKAEARFKAVNEAREVLSDPLKRAEYDRDRRIRRSSDESSGCEKPAAHEDDAHVRRNPEGTRRRPSSGADREATADQPSWTNQPPWTQYGTSRHSSTEGPPRSERTTSSHHRWSEQTSWTDQPSWTDRDSYGRNDRRSEYGDNVTQNGYVPRAGRQPERESDPRAVPPAVVWSCALWLLHVVTFVGMAVVNSFSVKAGWVALILWFPIWASEVILIIFVGRAINACRILLTIIGAAFITFFVFSLQRGSVFGVGTAIILVLQILIIIAAVATMLSPAARPYFHHNIRDT